MWNNHDFQKPKGYLTGPQLVKLWWLSPCHLNIVRLFCFIHDPTLCNIMLVNMLLYLNNFNFLLFFLINGHCLILLPWIWTACFWNSHPRQRPCYLFISERPNRSLGISFRCISSCLFNCRLLLFVLSLPGEIRSSRCLL